MKTSSTIFYGILFMLLLAPVFPLFSQSDAPLSAESLLLNSTANTPKLRTVNLFPFLHFTQDSALPDLQQFIMNKPTGDLPLAYCAADLAFFCRLEVQLEKATKIPVRFRLGDVQQVDYLEGKFEGWRYGQ